MFTRNVLRSTPRCLTRRTATSTRVGTRSIATVIQQGTEGWRLSLGRNPVKLDPGLRLKIPLYHTVIQVDMREQSVDIRELTGFTSDNVPVSVSGSLFYRVRNSYDACFAVDNFAQNVAFIGTSAMRSVVGNFTYDEVIGDRNAINRKLHDVIGHSIQKWGVDCTRFEIQHFQPSNRDVEKQLELQMAAERERRKKILDTQAMINVAEGHKQRVILESEGALQSQLNNAAGAKQKLILESQGTLEASKNQGQALAAQIDVLARMLAEPGKPSSEHKLKALEAFLELKRLEQLRAIARGHGNATYFFGDGQTTAQLGKDAYGVDNWESWKRGARKDTSGSNVKVAGEVGKDRAVLAHDRDDASSSSGSGFDLGGDRTHGGYRSSKAEGSPKPDVPFVPPTA